ncbi:MULTISPECIES: GUN4 domain-containing protein [unclassified Microcystis]|uniref:GUN4 domain-containing protein n=1 Tax=unclassified Microcystis TaxID=2643300 RepID=UPI00258E9A09|nr:MULTISPECIES: GUN4 domain-containing protein [unclassified Microcystis]MCA2761894.1 GUN4 domain-containing protein [Microcystis sp. M151S2]MCA2641428.1 GUN4 domain-containing protein [Microcystis sp. M087S2]MCA2673092.1 GUN4 domain-containing protein [Microcystis sp. M080S2]MCA2689186.1 GUN4 domain-containing protein [Microcystis sp. M037S2]MCA2734288.1 GUN4 domain-containing protein [Microcystis sp. M158S2]
MSLCLNPDCSHKNTPTDKFCHKCGSQLLLRERYRALKLIGQGGFGKTFQAIDEDKPSKPYCVIKQFFPSAQGTGTLQKAAELFREEAIRLDSLGRYPQIPELYAYFTANDGRQYLVQEYIEGQNLEQELKQEGVFNEAKIKHLLSEILPILEFIHSKQVIHRDIKPENIIRRKSDNKLILVDFGAAKFVSPLNRSMTGTIIGSAEYVAPEQGNGKAVNASDLYSLGVTGIYLLTGISPFDLFDVGEHEWVWRQWLVDNPVSNELGNILDKLIEFGTKRRYQSASEVLSALQIKTSVFVPQTTIQKPVNPVISVPQTPPSIQLKSAKGIDYRKLEDLLKRQQWKEADEETANLVRKVTNRVKDWLRDEDIQKFPCDDLQTIDQLWVHYSNGKFGFSVQGQIYLEIGGMEEYNERNWDIFGSLVGWQKNNSWNWQDINYSLQAPQGHLPLIRYGYKGQGSYIIYHLTSRIFVCQIYSHQIINQKQPVATIIQPPAISVPQTPPSIQLNSAKGIDYRNLEDLLKRQQWKQADEETARVMLQVANRTKERWLRESDIDNFPCEDLRTIDQLWVKYSNGKFGFSVQLKIYHDLGGTQEYNDQIWNAFGDKIGWRINNGWIDYKDVIFDFKALQGHLPADVPIWRCGNWHDPIWWTSCPKRGINLFSRVETCKM